MIQAIGLTLDVTEAEKQIDAHPEVWNTHRMRTEQYGTPHNGVSDIWCRYNRWENYTGDWAAFHDEHESEWYDVITKIPAVWSLTRKLKRFVGGKQLGGVLITRIPPGGRVEPHIDSGWHARYYDKYAIQLKGNQDQAFCFEDSELRAEAGQCYTFDNSKTHWVKNESDTDRMTLIVCVR